MAVKKVPVLRSIWARCFDIAFSKMRMQLLLLDLVAAWDILSMAGLWQGFSVQVDVRWIQFFFHIFNLSIYLDKSLTPISCV